MIWVADITVSYGVNETGLPYKSFLRRHGPEPASSLHEYIREPDLRLTEALSRDRVQPPNYPDIAVLPDAHVADGLRRDVVSGDLQIVDQAVSVLR